jgi:hypothetical protein
VKSVLSKTSTVSCSDKKASNLALCAAGNRLYCSLFGTTSQALYAASISSLFNVEYLPK